MRLVVGLFAMFLTASVARADEAKGPDPQPASSRAKMPLRVVRVLAESHQALLFDKNRGTHVLAEVGGTVAGYEVVEIEDDEVTLYANGREFVLAAPADLPAPAPAKPTRAPAKAKAEAPMDPYSDAGQNADSAPQDPYAEAPVRAVSVAPAPAMAPTRAPAVDAGSAAPVVDAGPAPRGTEVANPYDDAPVPSVTAAPAVKKPAAAPAKPARAVSLDGFLPPGTSTADAAPKTAPAPTPTPAAAAPTGTKPGNPADPYWVDGQTELPPSRPVRVTEGPAAQPAAPDAPPAPVITPTVLSRSELNATMADFNKLAGVLRGSFTPDGARLDAVAESSVFAKAGLRRGDVVTAIDGQPLRSIDDAAELYVRAANTKAANIQILRAGKPLTLRVLIQ